MNLTDLDAGIFVGLLVGEGSFGGDGRQPQVTLRMHTRHEALFLWLMERFPRTKLYGPYTHGGRSYYQWMARGRTLVEDVLPLLEDHLSATLDAHADERFHVMLTRYEGFITRERRRIVEDAQPEGADTTRDGEGANASAADDYPLSLGFLCERYDLDGAAIRRLAEFGAMLAHDPLAPTTLREPAAVRDDHLADSLVALELPVVTSAALIADLGAGAGLPGLPLAIARPAAHVVMVEGNGRKCEFIRGAIQRLGLRNATVVHGRAETWTEGLDSCDVVTARALARLDVLEEYAAPLLKVGGKLVAWRGKREPEVETAAARAAEILGLEIAEPAHVQPYPGAENRYLHVISKVRETPERFPRRDGMAKKRPLGDSRRTSL